MHLGALLGAAIDLSEVAYEVAGFDPLVEQGDSSSFDGIARGCPVGLGEGLHPRHRVVGAKLGQAQVCQQREEGDNFAVHLDLVLDEHERGRGAIALAFARGHDASARRSHDRCASPAAKVDAGVKEPAGGKREEPRGPLFAAEIGRPARAQELVAGARNLGEGADLDGEDKALQGAQDAFPVERAWIPFLLVQIDV